MGIRATRRLRRLTMTAAAGAVLAVLAPWAVPLGAVPVTLCTLVIYVMACALDWKSCTAAVAVYVLLGMAGLPVFSGFAGGVGCLAGPTGGFILGYPVMALVCSLLLGRLRRGTPARVGALALGTAVLYALGTLWYCAQTGVGLWGGLGVCVLPFLPGDGIKLAAAVGMGPALGERLARAGLTEGR